MISVQSLSDNFLPNVYIKSLTLDSTYSGEITNTKTDGYSDPNDTTYKTLGVGDQAVSKLVISMKFAKSKSVQSSMMHLLGDELSEYIKIFVHQITDQALYENILYNGVGKWDSDNLAGILNTEYPIDSKELSFKSMTTNIGSTERVDGNKINMPTQTLDDGTMLYESLLETSFSFDNDTSFLAYIIIPAIIHPDLTKSSGANNIPTGKVSADIILLNKSFQNEGLVFTIATPPAGSNKTELAKFGKPGEIWAGSVHRHPINGNFMAGPAHGAIPHPALDYQIIPVTKYVDNRVREKIERKILNVTKSFEQVNSLLTRYKGSTKNLLDYENYKKTTFISDIYLSQDRGLNINGMVSIDKLNLIKKKCAFPFIFDNIVSLPSWRAVLSKAVQLNIKFYENDKLVNNATRPRGSFTSSPVSVHSGGAWNALGVEHFVFQRKNESLATYKYRVEVEYKDPTIDYIKQFVNMIPPAQESVDTLIKRIQIRKTSAHGDINEAGYNHITQRINPELIKKIKNPPAGTRPLVSGDGILVGIAALFFQPQSNIELFFNAEDLGNLRSYITSLVQLDTATIDSLLILASFLQNLRTQFENILASSSSNSSKDDNPGQYGNLIRAGNVNSSTTDRTIKASSRNIDITIVDRGYDFIGTMSPNVNGLGITRLSHTRYRTTCRNLLKQLLRTGTVNEALASNIYPKGMPPKVVNASAFTYLTIPPSDETIRQSVLLPKNVVGNEKKVSDIFYAILKYNYLLTNGNSSYRENGVLGTRGAALKHSRKDLDTIMKQKFATYLPNMLPSAMTEESPLITALYSEIDPNPPPPSPPSAAEQIDVEEVAQIQQHKNFFLNSLLGRLLISRNYSLVPEMTKDNFLPYSIPNSSAPTTSAELYEIGLSALAKAGHVDPGSNAFRLPLSVLALSVNTTTSVFGGNSPDTPLQNDNFSKVSLTGEKEQYIEKNIINPEKLWYYWFIHQNIVKVEYLDGYEETKETVFLKDLEQPGYASALRASSKEIIRRNIKKPRWKMMNKAILDSMDNDNAQQLFCRVTRYDYSYYIDESLVKALDLPLIDQYFIIEKGN